MLLILNSEHIPLKCTIRKVWKTRIIKPTWIAWVRYAAGMEMSTYAAPVNRVAGLIVSPKYALANKQIVDILGLLTLWPPSISIKNILDEWVHL
jgi:hypothetical protein